MIVLPETTPTVALMVAVLRATPVARPVVLTVATPVFDEVQTTSGVIS
jgi:hypothetical protein